MGNEIQQINTLYNWEVIIIYKNINEYKILY